MRPRHKLVINGLTVLLNRQLSEDEAMSRMSTGDLKHNARKLASLLNTGRPSDNEATASIVGLDATDLPTLLPLEKCMQSRPPKA